MVALLSPLVAAIELDFKISLVAEYIAFEADHFG